MNSGELKVDVPLASIESDVEDEDESGASKKKTTNKIPSAVDKNRLAGGGGGNKSRSASANRKASPRFNLDGADDSVTGSLEDLVNSFDEKLTKVFHDYQAEVAQIAPVQVRSQEEIMNECQVWWTITGNFGSMMPIDWSKSTARAKHLPTLNLNKGQTGPQQLMATAKDNLEEEDDIVAADLDMHSLILTSNPCENAAHCPSAEEVIKEIDDIIEADDDDETLETPEAPDPGQTPVGGAGGGGGGAGFASYQRSSRIVSQALAGRKLEDLSSNELTQILSDVEILVRDLSEELVNDLGVRDELEYEKELKNTFISLLLSIQSKRRQHMAEGGKVRRDPRDQFKYLTTVIPYQPDRGAPPIPSLQALVKILKAINEDSPAVPALLTDYILKVLCPS